MESLFRRNGGRAGQSAYVGLAVGMALVAAAAACGAPAGSDPRELDDFRQLLRRDSIEPIYDPQFVQSDEADLEPDDLVMGVSINGDSRAYPIRYLQWREMVNDEVGGIPILVTW